MQRWRVPFKCQRCIDDEEEPREFTAEDSQDGDVSMPVSQVPPWKKAPLGKRLQKRKVFINFEGGPVICGEYEHSICESTHVELEEGVLSSLNFHCVNSPPL
jgi:hypothetical protein